jgi:hypothetical protein
MDVDCDSCSMLMCSGDSRVFFNTKLSRVEHCRMGGVFGRSSAVDVVHSTASSPVMRKSYVIQVANVRRAGPALSLEICRSKA